MCSMLNKRFGQNQQILGEIGSIKMSEGRHKGKVYLFKYSEFHIPSSNIKRSKKGVWRNVLHFLQWSKVSHATSARHWQESQSRKISRRNDSIFSRSLEKIGFSFLFLFLIFKIFRNIFISFLDLWDFLIQSLSLFNFQDF